MSGLASAEVLPELAVGPVTGDRRLEEVGPGVEGLLVVGRGVDRLRRVCLRGAVDGHERLEAGERELGEDLVAARPVVLALARLDRRPLQDGADRAHPAGMHPLVVGRALKTLRGDAVERVGARIRVCRHRLRSRRARPARRRRRRRSRPPGRSRPCSACARRSAAAGTGGDHRRHEEQRRADQQRGREARQRIAGSGERGRRDVGLADDATLDARSPPPLPPPAWAGAWLTLLSVWLTPGNWSTYSSSAGAAAVAAGTGSTISVATIASASLAFLRVGRSMVARR